MITGSLPFVLYLQAPGTPGKAVRDTQCAGSWPSYGGRSRSSAVLYLSQDNSAWVSNRRRPFQHGVRHQHRHRYSTAALTPGFIPADYLLVMMSSGVRRIDHLRIKVFRFQVLYCHRTVRLKRLLQPHGVLHSPITTTTRMDEEIALSVLGLSSSIFLVFISLLALGPECAGLTFLTKPVGSADGQFQMSARSRRSIARSEHFADLPDAANGCLGQALLWPGLSCSPSSYPDPAFWRKAGAWMNPRRADLEILAAS